MPTFTKAQVAADLLLKTTSTLGLPVPEYAKKVFDFDRHTPIADDKRVQVDLEALLTGLTDEMRLKLFSENPRLALWYELYTQCSGDIQCEELTWHMGRSAQQIRAEHAAKKQSTV